MYKILTLIYDLKPDQTEIYIQSSIYQVYRVRLWHNRKCFIGKINKSLMFADEKLLNVIHMLLLDTMQSSHFLWVPVCS